MSNKKDIVYDTLRHEEVEICGLQEVNLKKDYPVNLIASKDYKIEIEKHKHLARTAIVIKNNIEYVRREDLETEDTSVVIIDTKTVNAYRIINVYRNFSPPNNQSQKDHFAAQLLVIKNALRELNGINPILIGDFNLDEKKKYSTDYRNKHLFEQLNVLTDELHLIQLIKEPTWQRIVNNTLRESTLDHLYVTNPTLIENINLKTPIIGDHKLILFNAKGIKKSDPPIIKRNWQKYTSLKLNDLLSKITFEIEADKVQDIWNKFESTILPVVDSLIPYEPFVENTALKTTEPSPIIKRKINLRKKLLKQSKILKTNALRDRIKNLNVEIKRHFLIKKRNSIRRKIVPGNSKSLWEAVKIAKDSNKPKIPNTMFLNTTQINSDDLPDTFADFFKNKVQNIVNNQVIDDQIYNGKRKVNVNSVDFMTENDVLKAVKSLKSKNCEGHDRIPVRIISDGIQHLLKPLSYLFSNIYIQKQIPEQWLISKITPLLKKGNPSNVENYRPISNLCSCSKIFERLILQRIKDIETDQKTDLTGKSQHGFKTKHSTLTAGLQIQSLIASALDGDSYALMASLDLSAAFDVVDVQLLLKRLEIIGLPDDILILVRNWLSSRYFYVDIDGKSSYIHETDVGTVQGSILGPVLYALFVSPILDLEKLTLFADDNYAVVWNKDKNLLILNMQRKLERITNWLVKSGMKVNETKTELCLFHKRDQPPITLVLNNQTLTSKPQMNVLGVSFDSKLNWQTHISTTIAKAKKSLNAIYLIKKYFNTDELRTIITSNYFSVLYYNSEIWHLPSLTLNTKKILMSASAAPLKLCTTLYDQNMSFITLHSITKRATPPQMMKYKLALQLHKLYNNENMSNDWLSLFFNQNFNGRNSKANFRDTSNHKIGKNLIANRLSILNNEIEYDWLNLEKESYKLKCKILFLSN